MQTLGLASFPYIITLNPCYDEVINYCHPHCVDGETEVPRSHTLPRVTQPRCGRARPWTLSNFPGLACAVTAFCLPGISVAVYQEKACSVAHLQQGPCWELLVERQHTQMQDSSALGSRQDACTQPVRLQFAYQILAHIASRG